MELIVDHTKSLIGKPVKAPAISYPARQPNTQTDQTMWGVTLLLIGIGLVSVYSASSVQALREFGNPLAYVLKQGLMAGVGLVGMGWFARQPVQRWERFAQPFGVVVLGLLLFTMLFGHTSNGSERWIPLPFGAQLQPSDLAKLSAILLMAQLLSKPKLQLKLFLINLGMVAAMTLLIYQQPNLSVTIILFTVCTLMTFMAGWPGWLYLGLIPAGWAVWEKIQHIPYQWRRIVGWLDPWKDVQDTGYNLIQSYFAIGGGGLFGVGLGRSLAKHGYLPFQHTDFIFSVICEETGIGGIILIGLFAVLVARGFIAARHAKTRFNRLVGFGLTAALAIQTTINIAVTIGMMPVTGVTLPLISYGGTSMIATLITIGMLLSLSRQPVEV